MIGQLTAFWGGGGETNNAQVFDGSFVYDEISTPTYNFGTQSFALVKFRADSGPSGLGYISDLSQTSIPGSNGLLIAVDYTNNLLVIFQRKSPSRDSVVECNFSDYGKATTAIFIFDTLSTAPNAIYINGVSQALVRNIARPGTVGTYSIGKVGSRRDNNNKLQGLIQAVEIGAGIPSAQAITDAKANGTFVGADGIADSDFYLRFNANKKAPAVPTDNSNNAYPITVNGGLTYAPFEDS